jgi:hypothetical protein
MSRRQAAGEDAMSVPRPRRFLVILKPGCVSPGVAGQNQDDHRMRGIVRVIPATDRM